MHEEAAVSDDLAERLRFESLVIDRSAGFVDVESERSGEDMAPGLAWVEMLCLGSTGAGSEGDTQ